MIDENKLIERLQEYIISSTSGDFAHGLVTAVYVTMNQPKIGGWIPCSERLPEMWKDVMICYYNDKEEKYLSDIAYLDDDGCWNLCREAGGYFPPNFKKKITHWQHLSDLPEECHG